VNFWDLNTILLHLGDQLGSVELAVTPASLQDLALLIKREVLVGEAWADVFGEEVEDLVVGDSTGVGEVVNTLLVVLGKNDGDGEHRGEEGVAVWNVDDFLVLGDLGDERSRVEVVRDWHAESENQNVVVLLHDLLNLGLGSGVVAAREVGGVLLGEGLATDWMGIVVFVDASGSEDGDMDSLQITAICEVQGTDDIASDGLFLVIFAPVDIGSSGDTSAVENVSWLVFIELRQDRLTVFHADSGGGDLLSLALEKGLEVTSNPSFSTPDQKLVSSHYECVFS